MAITISGENNNDRILAQDGVIDSISGFNIAGIITASSFTGDLTGDVTGNLTGNVTGNINNSTLLLQTGGTERLRILSNGKVLVGTTIEGHSNADDLTIATSGDTGMTIRSGTSSFGSLFFSDGTSGGDELMGAIEYYHHDDYMKFRTGASERLRIDSSGKIGISRTPTQHPLEIQHSSEPTVSLWRGSTKGAALQAQSGGTYLYSYENAPIVFSVNSASGFTERLRIDSNGDINLGNNPTNQYGYKLNIEDSNQILYAQTASSGGTELKLYLDHGNTVANFGTVSTSHLAFVTTNTERLRIDSSGNVTVKSSTNNQQPKLRIESYGEYGEIKADGNGSIVIDADPDFNANDSYIGFKVDGSEKARITSAGRFGIGTDNPSTYKLHLIGSTSALARFERSGGAFAKVDIKAGSSSGNSYLTFSDPDATEVGEINYEHADNSLRFNTNGGERLRITSTGQLNVAGNMQFTAGTPELEFNNGGPRFRVPAANTLTVHTGGTLGSTNNEALRITSNKDVLIGSTSEVSDTKVVIAGNVNQYNADKGTGAGIKTFVLGRNYSMSTSSTDVLLFDNWGNSAFDITVFRRDSQSPAGSQVMKLYLAFVGSGTNITAASLVQETKVTRGSIHTTAYSISENNNTATLSVTGNDNGGESQSLTFYIIAQGAHQGYINVI